MNLTPLFLCSANCKSRSIVGSVPTSIKFRVGLIAKATPRFLLWPIVPRLSISIRLHELSSETMAYNMLCSSRIYSYFSKLSWYFTMRLHTWNALLIVLLSLLPAVLNAFLEFSNTVSSTNEKEVTESCPMSQSCHESVVENGKLSVPSAVFSLLNTENSNRWPSPRKFRSRYRN